MKNKKCCAHSKSCRYNEEDLLLYAALEFTNGRTSLISANESALYDRYLDYALNKDKDVSIDLESHEKQPYQLVYGGLMFSREEINIIEIQSSLEQNKETAFIDLDSEKDGHVTASLYYDIKLFPDNEAATDGFVPFVALMKTHHVLHDKESSITMFPYGARLVWEDMINRPFLLACRETASFDDLSRDNWKDHIDEDLLMRVFKVADLYTPKENDSL